MRRNVLSGRCAPGARPGFLKAAAVLAALFYPSLVLPAPGAATLDLSLGDRRAVIDERVAFYNATFPRIKFVAFEGGRAWRSNMSALQGLLGEGAVNLDYEVPAHSDADLLEVNLDRIARFLRGNVVSSASFRVGQGSVAGREYLCLVALNPSEFASDPVAATRQMVSISEEDFAMLHPGRLVNVRAHLRFAVDHEVFHCLESTFYGGSLLNGEPHGGEYNGFRRESAADAFALAMHIREHGRRTDYAENIALIRALWLVNECPDNTPFETIRAVYRAPVDRLAELPPRELVDFVIDLRNRLVGSYDEYVAKRASMRGETLDDGAPANAGPAPALRDRMARYQFYLQQLFVDTPVKFAPPDDWSR